MTDEEISKLFAAGYATKELNPILRTHLYECAKESFLAGLKTGKDMNVVTKWHKVADGDLPNEPEFLKSYPDNHRYEWFLVATVGKPDKALYSFAKKKWFIDYEEMMLGDSCFKPIAWCEIPQYTKE